MRRVHHGLKTALGLIVFLAPGWLLADPLPANYFETTPNKFPQFAAATEDSQYRFDFSVLNEVLQAMVVDFGQPDRVGVARPAARRGSRFTFGHTSKYRLEANRIPYSFLDNKATEVLTQLRTNIEAVGNQVPLDQLSRKSQMAFWMNLHNVLVIEQLALHYPTTFPEDIRIGPNQLRLHEAKLTKIQGIELSLQDIRTEIVYRNWRNPNAIYGFYRGTIGGPNIQTRAYTEANIDRLLKQNATQFVNSLRGVAKTNKHITLSKIYADSKPLFPAWPNDLVAHLSQHSGPIVSATLALSLPLDARTYDPKIADFAGGRPVRGAPSPVTEEVLPTRLLTPDRATTQPGLRPLGGSVPASANVKVGFVEVLLQERNEKERRLRFRELRDQRFKGKGTVVVEEIEQEDDS